MRRLALLICLFLFVVVAYGGSGYTQSQRRPKRVKPVPTPRPTPEPDSFEGLPPYNPNEDFYADILPAKPTPKPATDNVLDLLPDAEPEPPSEWELILFQDESAYAYNTRRITRPTPGVVKVWIKWNLYGAKRKKYISEMREVSPAYSKYFYSLQLEEYDCKGFRRRLLKVVDYTILEEFIDSTEMKGEWTDVTPESIGEAILLAVCSHKQ